jgi:hypothetical protein
MSLLPRIRTASRFTRSWNRTKKSNYALTESRDNLRGAQEVRRSPQAQGRGFGEHTAREKERCFFGYFLCTSKESDSLAQRVKAFAFIFGTSKEKSLDSGLRRNDEHYPTNISRPRNPRPALSTSKPTNTDRPASRTMAVTSLSSSVCISAAASMACIRRRNGASSQFGIVR